MVRNPNKYSSDGLRDTKGKGSVRCCGRHRELQRAKATYHFAVGVVVRRVGEHRSRRVYPRRRSNALEPLGQGAFLADAIQIALASSMQAAL